MDGRVCYDFRMLARATPSHVLTATAEPLYLNGRLRLIEHLTWGAQELAVPIMRFSCLQTQGASGGTVWVSVTESDWPPMRHCCRRLIVQAV